MKPETIYLSDNNGKDEMVAKIGDYHIQTLKQSDLAKEKQISGTPFYMLLRCLLTQKVVVKISQKISGLWESYCMRCAHLRSPLLLRRYLL